MIIIEYMTILWVHMEKTKLRCLKLMGGMLEMQKIFIMWNITLISFILPLIVNVSQMLFLMITLEHMKQCLFG